MSTYKSSKLDALAEVCGHRLAVEYPDMTRDLKSAVPSLNYIKKKGKKMAKKAASNVTWTDAGPGSVLRLLGQRRTSTRDTPSGERKDLTGKFEKYLTKNDVTRKFSVPVEWLTILPGFGKGHEVVVKAIDGKGFYWEFCCVIRKRGHYKKPVFQSRGWLKFVKENGLRVGDKIVLSVEEDLFRAAKFRIRAQKCNEEGVWVDV